MSGSNTGPPTATDYTPRYVALDDVPIASEGTPTRDVSNDTKRLALKEAEAQFDADVNGGAPVDVSALPAGGWAAVRNLASFVIYNPALDPREGINLGEVEEYGGAQVEYVNQYLNRYESLVASITDTPGDSPGDGGDGGGGATPDFEFRAF